MRLEHISDFEILLKLHSTLEDESPLPYMIDILDFTHSNHNELKNHIERVGKVIFEEIE